MKSLSPEELRALYDHDQRMNFEEPCVRREVTPHTVRQINENDPESFVIYSKLTPENADQVIEDETGYFQSIGHNFEWKYYSHDTPSDLIERRPDIRSAENSLIAASARIEVAKKEYFPRISLTSFLGYQSGQLTSLFSGSRNVWNLAGQISQPIFTGGRIKSNIRFTQAQRDFLLVDYQKTVQGAFREVSDALISYQKVKEVRTQRALLVDTLRDRSRLSYLRYTGGVATLLDALDADRQLFDAERSLALARRDELLSVVQLYKALGGGWQ